MYTMISDFLVAADMVETITALVQAIFKHKAGTFILDDSLRAIVTGDLVTLTNPADAGEEDLKRVMVSVRSPTHLFFSDLKQVSALC